MSAGCCMTDHIGRRHQRQHRSHLSQHPSSSQMTMNLSHSAVSPSRRVSRVSSRRQGEGLGENSTPAAVIAGVNANQAGESPVPGAVKRPESSAVGTMRMMNEHSAGGARKDLMAPAFPTLKQITPIQINEQTAASTEVHRDLRHQGHHHPQPRADRVPQLPLAQERPTRPESSVSPCCMDRGRVQSRPQRILSV